MTESLLFNPEAEALALSAILRYPDEFWSLDEVGLRSQDFLAINNQRVMKAIRSVVNEKKSPDVPLVLEELRINGEESADYVLKLAEQPCSIAQGREYIRTVKGLSTSRALAAAGAKIIEVAREERSDYESALAKAESLLWEVKKVVPPSERGSSAADILERMRQAPPSETIPIRFSPTLQNLTQGLGHGQFWVIGGFSSVGKSAFAINMALDVLKVRGKVPAIMSLEMTSEAYMLRFESLVSGVPQRVLRSGASLPMDDMEGVDLARRKLANSTLHIDDTVRTLEHIRSKATRLKETKGLDVLFVDFIQNIYVKGDEFGDARASAIELQSLAKELDLTVVSFSQVSNDQARRDSEGGDRNFYTFKSHGAIRDSADVAIMLRRDRIALSPSLAVSIVKNRSDALGDFYCEMTLETGKIQEITQELA